MTSRLSQVCRCDTIISILMEVDGVSTLWLGVSSSLWDVFEYSLHEPQPLIPSARHNEAGLIARSTPLVGCA